MILDHICIIIWLIKPYYNWGVLCVKRVYLFITSLFIIVSLTACKTQSGALAPQPTTEPAATVQVTDSIQNNEIEAEQAEIKYIGNKISKKFHRPGCSSLPAEKNRVELTKREEAIDMGFVPCKRCNP